MIVCHLLCHFLFGVLCAVDKGTITISRHVSRSMVSFQWQPLWVYKWLTLPTFSAYSLGLNGIVIQVGAQSTCDLLQYRFPFFVVHPWSLTTRPWNTMLVRLLSLLGLQLFRGYVKLWGFHLLFIYIYRERERELTQFTRGLNWGWPPSQATQDPTNLHFPLPILGRAPRIPRYKCVSWDSTCIIAGFMRCTTPPQFSPILIISRLCILISAHDLGMYIWSWESRAPPVNVTSPRK